MVNLLRHEVVKGTGFSTQSHNSLHIKVSVLIQENKGVKDLSR